jgi:hypothetical protein
MKLTIVVLTVTFLSLGCSTTDVLLVEVAPVETKHQVCSTNSECVLIQRDCGDCDCGTPINKNYHLEYTNEKNNRCATFKGPVCDLWCPSNISICLNGKCVEE